jgi:hypothetical protein
VGPTCAHAYRAGRLLEHVHGTSLLQPNSTPIRRLDNARSIARHRVGPTPAAAPLRWRAPWGVHGWPFKIHMTYWAAVTAAMANAREKTSCLRAVMPRTVARQAGHTGKRSPEHYRSRLCDEPTARRRQPSRRTSTRGANRSEP